MFDLRSDTVTRPTEAMRRAMAAAVVGDDVFGDDPTVQELERETAALLGRDAALFVPSGTMANQISLGLLASPGTEVLAEENTHLFNYEAGGAAALWGVTLRPLPGERGRLSPRQIRDAVRPPNHHFAPLRAVTMENTHNRAGGVVWPPDALHAAMDAARECGVAVHLDGARLWNAAVATGRSPADLARGADTVSVCFSKGLGAPVGSAIAARADLIDRARYLRKRLGGGMRQAGIIAAGALHALRHHRERLVEDHRRAAAIAEALAGVRGIQVFPVESNIIIVDFAETGRTPDDVVAALEREGIRALGFGKSRIRLVTHLDVGDDAVEHACRVLPRVLEAGR